MKIHNRKPERPWPALAFVMLPMLVVVLGGCESSDTATGEPDSTSAAGTPSAVESHMLRPPRHHDAGVASATGDAQAGSPGASTGSNGGNLDCSVCTRANDCCNAVGAGGLCTFSSASCASYSGLAQQSYVETCLSLIQTTIDAWKASGAVPPAVCTLP